MFWLYTDNTHNTVALDNFAVTTDFFYGCTNFHFNTPVSKWYHFEGCYKLNVSLLNSKGEGI